MAEAVVNLFKFIQIEKQQRHVGLLTLCPRQRHVQSIPQQCTVGQVRERVVLGHKLQAAEHLLALNGRGHLGGNKLQELLIMFAARRVVLHNQRANNAFV